jgi:S-adenosylmethionine hydrolase
MEVEGPLPTYSAASGRAPLALVGSSGYLEIAVRDASAAAALATGRGAEVRLEPLGGPVRGDRAWAGTQA